MQAYGAIPSSPSNSSPRSLTLVVALGVSVLLLVRADTSLTNFFAFLLGSQSSLPAVEYFCNYASTAILFDFFLQVCVCLSQAKAQFAVRSRRLLSPSPYTRGKPKFCSLIRGVDVTPGWTFAAV